MMELSKRAISKSCIWKCMCFWWRNLRLPYLSLFHCSIFITCVDFGLLVHVAELCAGKANCDCGA